ncbi:MAG: hypothetical protein OSB21_06700 [Myxococcota bacterium]|nr:hypothetical protein [Myxococcota bacterium]
MNRFRSLSALMLLSATSLGCAESVVAPLQTLSNWGEEAAGDNCLRGGYRVDSGVDADGDAALAEAEITASEYLCNPERPTEGNVLIRKSFLDGANAECPGGFVRIDYGFDADGNAELSDDEVSAQFVTCNQLPSIESLPGLNVESCEEAIVVTASASDIDGSIASYEWTVLSSASVIEISGADTNEVTVAAGNHLGGATLRLTVTDDLGASRSRNFSLAFLGTGCLPHETFYGIDPTSCTAVDIESAAGDDRGGSVVSNNYVFYNGDRALVRTALDLSGLQSVGPEDVDTLFADSLTNSLYSLWHSDLDLASIADATNGQLEDATNTGFNQIVPVNEETLAVGTPVNLAASFRVGSYNLEVEGVSIERRTYGLLVAARDGRLVIGVYNQDESQDFTSYYLQYQVFSLENGALISSTRLDHPLPGEESDIWDSKRFEDQETNIVSYPMVATGDGGDRIIFKSNGGWHEYNVTSDELTARTSSFADDCDVQQLSLVEGNTVAYFHDEGSCFSSLSTDESLIRCNVLFGDNTDGAINDSGGQSNPP